MKKNVLLLLAPALLCFGIAQAQTQKGTNNLGLNFSVYHTETKTSNYSVATGFSNQTNNYTTYGIGPSFSHFIADGLDIGGYAAYAHFNSNNGPGSYPSEGSGYSFAAALNVRKYFLYQNKFGIRVGPYVNYSRGHQSDNNFSAFYNYTNDSKTEEYGVGGNLDLVFYPMKKLGVTASIAKLGYDHATNNTVSNDANSSLSGSTVNSFNLGFTNGLSLTCFYLFGGK